MDGASSFITQATAYYTSQGTLGKITDMTNFSILSATDGTDKVNGFSADTDLNSDTATVDYWCDGGKVMNFTTESNATGFSLTIIDATSGNAAEKVAKNSSTALDSKGYYKEYVLGGQNIKF
jgi:hypothetical protein